jgi:hypothetical protein
VSRLRSHGASLTLDPLLEDRCRRHPHRAHS